MSTTTRDRQPAALIIPAGYLGDALLALVAEIDVSSGALKGDPAELASPLRILRKDMQLLDQLVDAVGDTELTAQHDEASAPLVEMLEQMCRRLAERLRDVAHYGPMPMGDVLDIAAQLRWAAEEAIRIEPSMSARLGATDWQRGRSDHEAAA